LGGGERGEEGGGGGGHVPDAVLHISVLVHLFLQQNKPQHVPEHVESAVDLVLKNFLCHGFLHK
jgi:hypothetical protein